MKRVRDDFTLPFQRLVIVHIRLMNLELNDVQAAVLIRELHSIIQNDRYPLSPRIVVLNEILAMMRPAPRVGITNRPARSGIVGDGSKVIH